MLSLVSAWMHIACEAVWYNYIYVFESENMLAWSLEDVPLGNHYRSAARWTSSVDFEWLRKITVESLFLAKIWWNFEQHITKPGYTWLLTLIRPPLSFFSP